MTRLCPPEAKTLSDGLPIVLGFTESREGVPEVTEDKTAETPEHETAELIERRSLTDAALVATPLAILAQPIVGALANKYIGEKPKDDPPPQEPKKD